MKRIFTFLSLLLSLFLAPAGCRTADPLFSGEPVATSWAGDLSDFYETEDGGWILDSPETTGEATVYMPVDAPSAREYAFRLLTDLNPSSRNYARFYLWSETPDPQNPGEAYFIRLGYTDDNVCLCHQTGTKAPTVRIAGRQKLLDADGSDVAVRLTVDEAGTFRLFTRLYGEPAETEEGTYTAQEPLPLRPGYLMLNCKFTSKGRNAFAFDAIRVQATGSSGKPEPPDISGDAPAVSEVRPLSDRSFRFVFDRETDWSEALFTLNGKPAAGISAAGNGRELTVTFAAPMQPGATQRLIWKGIRARNGQTTTEGSLEFTYAPDDEPDRIGPGDVVINEILYEPFSGGSEYFEVYNRTARDLSVAGLAVAVRRQDGNLSTAYPLSGAREPLQAEGYLAFTRDKAGVEAFYSVERPDKLCEIAKLPALSNSGATLVLFDAESRQVIDEAAYSPSWHDPLLRPTRGVSLERISADAPSNESANWISAAGSAGGGTPGYRNSQAGFPSAGTQAPGFSAPVRDPVTGIYTCSYLLDKAGYTCRSEIYDTAGRLTARITVGETVGTAGTLRWDGKGTAGKPLPEGLYICYAEFIHPEGKVHRFKKAFVVRR